MIVEITKASIDKEQVVLEGTNLETVFVSEDLFEDIPEETVRFVFDRHEHPVLKNALPGSSNSSPYYALRPWEFFLCDVCK